MPARTTLIIDENVLADAKRLALDTGRTLTRFVEDALRESIVRAREPKPVEPFELQTLGSWKLNPEIDFSNNAKLTELMDEEDRARGRWTS